MSVKFRNKYKLPSDKIFYTEAGTEIVPVFELSDDASEVIQVGKTNVVEEINSFADSTDMNVIKKQLICGNETITEAFRNGIFSADKNSYGDTTIAPKLLGEYQKIIRTAIGKYNALPEEIRKHFDTVDDFINASDDTIKDIINSINTVKDEQSDNVEKEKIEDAE